MQQKPSQSPVPAPVVASLTEAMQRFGYRDPAPIRRLIASGKLRAFRGRGPNGFPGPWRISIASMEELLRGQAEQGSPNTDALPGPTL